MQTFTIGFIIDWSNNPPSYAGITISTTETEVARFYSDDPLVDWGHMITHMQSHPGHYMTSSSFEEFSWYVPGFRFILNADNKEILAIDHHDFLDGVAPENGKHAVSMTTRFIDAILDDDTNTYRGLVLRTRQNEIISFMGNAPESGVASMLDYLAGDTNGILLTRNVQDLNAFAVNPLRTPSFIVHPFLAHRSFLTRRSHRHLPQP